MTRKRRHAASAAPFLALAALFAIVPLLAAGTAGAEPLPQPIYFPHLVHVTGYGLDCRFCHSSADKSQYANIPSVQKCMTCHRTIATDRPEVKKLAQYWKEGKPVRWTRVNDVPNHVYFPHRKMVNAGVACLTCHPGMDHVWVAEQKREFGMGMCMDCHRRRKVSIDCWTCHY
jgi:hypothetical protein